ncbi:universal stress protein UspE [Mariniflexile rhizosphaerae]|uniref:universal stress protein n=1 Tax=unclassified Mariniflexile TaxID=2643887 RepID=UPI000CB0FFC9|nr:universal stress protein [Mariniflexile sp. TRM1-10]AXP82271.1 universal stress protein UspE [Mariniflexile sp. TRM1-10]PLB20367.1 MAG: Universal stress protein [Flavobacteriaceae bacterium FS1-H7996/R]
MKTILLPTDFSENSWNAIKYALKFYENSTCTFYLLHVNILNYAMAEDSLHIDTEDLIENTFIKPSKLQLRKTLKRISQEFPVNKNHHFFMLTDYNFFIDSVRKYVDEKKIDMIIMGTKGATGLKKIIIGSNAADVIKKVKCTTLIVPENATFTNLNEIAFPTDYFLTYGVNLLKPIYEIIEMHHASLRVVHISHDFEKLSLSQQDNKDLLQDYFSNFEMRFYNLTNKDVEDAIECFVQSRDIDMIAMVAKNLNFFQQILFHSKVEEISYHTNIPFLVIHE